ncbi:MAG: hypothetical protein Q8R21_01135, partial [Burkholderiales bacterium]|nr:hypothetical protein [Burkholderiales bacterium]
REVTVDEPRQPNRTGELARNVEIALRFKQKQGTPEMPQVEKEVLAPSYDRVRGEPASRQQRPQPVLAASRLVPARGVSGPSGCHRADGKTYRHVLTRSAVRGFGETR